MRLESFYVNVELEKRLIAGILARPEIYWEILDIMPPEALTETREIYKDIVKAIENEKPLPQIDIEAKPIEDYESVARELANLYQKRLLANFLQELSDELRGEKLASELITNIEEKLAWIQQSIKELQAREVSFADLIQEVVTEVANNQAIVKKQGTVGLPTGIPKIDKLLGGLQPGLHLLAGEPGQGKTTFALQIASKVAEEGFPVLFLSFEEALPRLALKVICARAGLEAKKIIEGYGDLKELNDACRVYGPKLNALHFMEGTARLTTSQVKAKALQLMNKFHKNKCLVIVDYLQRWAAGKRDYSEFRHVVSMLVSELREISLRLNSPIIAISSQNRPGQGKALLTSLKESGDLEYSADTALFLVEDEDQSSTPPARSVKLVIEKNRYGDKGVIKLIFRPDIGIFREVAKE